MVEPFEARERNTLRHSFIALSIRPAGELRVFFKPPQNETEARKNCVRAFFSLSQHDEKHTNRNNRAYIIDRRGLLLFLLFHGAINLRHVLTDSQIEKLTCFRANWKVVARKLQTASLGKIGQATWMRKKEIHGIIAFSGPFFNITYLQLHLISVFCSLALCEIWATLPSLGYIVDRLDGDRRLAVISWDGGER